MPALVTTPFGPLSKGVIDTANPSLNPLESFRSARNLLYTGLNRLSIRPGTRTQLTLLDDSGTPAPITSVCAVTPFMEGALAVGYSSTTSKVYLYRLNATLDGWYTSAGVLTTPATTARPVGVVWDSVPTPPDVMIAEGLGIAYIANTGAADENGLYWRTKSYQDFATISDVLASGTGGSAGSDPAYFSGVVSFAQHLWAWGYGAGSTVGYTSYRPELARFSQPNFGAFQTADSITLGDRVRTLRERIIGGAVVGQALVLMGASLLTRVTGSGRDSWYKTQIDRSYGVVGPKAFVTAGDVLYYWSPQGPMRISDSGAPDPLWDAIPAAVGSVANSAQIVAGFDLERNQVVFWYNTGNGVRTFCAFDTRRNVWLGPDSDIGVPLRCAGSVAPLYRSTTNAPIGPSAAPVIVSTTSVGNNTALATWTNGDPLSQTEISYRPIGGAYTVLPFVAAGVSTYTFSGLIPGTSYEWRVRHVRNGQYSAYDGPKAASQFTTSSVTLSPPTSFSASQYLPDQRIAQASWTPSGDAQVSTEIWVRAGSGSYLLYKTVGPGQSDTTFAVGANGSYTAKARHVRSGSIDSAYSNTSSFVVSTS